MSGALPQAFFAIVMVVALALMGRAAIHTNERLYQSQVLQATNLLDSAQTALEIAGVQPVGAGQQLLLELHNSGKRQIGDWHSIDLIIDYETASGSTSELLAYDAAAAAPGTWLVVAGSGSDVYQPGILDQDETVWLEAYLTQTPEAGSIGRVQLTLGDGASYRQVIAFP